MTCTRSYTQSEVPMAAEAVKLAMVMREEEEYDRGRGGYSRRLEGDEDKL